MKKKGFTLIELIVVIAIIGVLAAILVPAMLGYVRKSKITTANTTAKSIYNAYNTALVDLDTVDEAVTFTTSTADQSGAGFATSNNKLEKMVYTYFTDIAKVSKFAVTATDGACTACGVLNGNYPGAYPNPWTTEAYNSGTKPTTAVAAMSGPSASGSNNNNNNNQTPQNP